MTYNQKIVLTLLGAAAFVLPMLPSTTTYTAEAAIAAKKPTLTHAQDLWLASLEWCESRGNPNVKVLDSNDKYSYGAFQFQMQTFLWQGKKHGLVATSTTEKQGKTLIYDYGLQRQLVAIMVSNGLEYHWKNCTRKIGPYPKDLPTVPK